MKLLTWILGGAVGGLIGAVIWAVITYFSHTEIGWIAWGIGALAGIGVRIAAGDDVGELPGATALVLALLSVLGGKFLATELLIQSLASGSSEIVKMDDNDMITWHARQICEDRVKQGKPVVFANGKTLDDAERADFPIEIVAEATGKWNALPADERKKQTAEREQEIAELMGMMKGALRQVAFTNSFSAYDLLWFGLAALTAFRFGSGQHSSDD